MTQDEEFKRIHERLDRHSERLHNLEQNQLDLSQRYDALESDVSTMSSKFSLYQNEINNALRSMKRWIIVIGSIAAGAFMFMAIKNEKAAQAVVTLGSTLAKLVVV